MNARKLVVHQSVKHLVPVNYMRDWNAGYNETSNVNFGHCLS